MAVRPEEMASWVGLVVQAAVGLGAAYIGARTTIRATKETLRGAVQTEVKANRKVRWEEAGERRRASWELAKGELQNNQRMRPHLHVYHAWLPLETDALRSLLNSVPDAEPKDLQALGEAYRQIRTYNAAASYSNEKVQFGSGAMDEYLAKTAEALEEPIAQALTAIENAFHEGE
jgi:hypothetical protein